MLQRNQLEGLPPPYGPPFQKVPEQSHQQFPVEMPHGGAEHMQTQWLGSAHRPPTMMAKQPSPRGQPQYTFSYMGQPPVEAIQSPQHICPPSKQNHSGVMRQANILSMLKDYRGDEPTPNAKRSSKAKVKSRRKVCDDSDDMLAALSNMQATSMPPFSPRVENSARNRGNISHTERMITGDDFLFAGGKASDTSAVWKIKSSYSSARRKNKVDDKSPFAKLPKLPILIDVDGALPVGKQFPHGHSALPSTWPSGQYRWSMPQAGPPPQAAMSVQGSSPADFTSACVIPGQMPLGLKAIQSPLTMGVMMDSPMASSPAVTVTMSDGTPANKTIMMDVVEPTGVPMARVPNAMYLQELPMKQKVGNIPHLHPHMKFIAPQMTSPVNGDSRVGTPVAMGTVVEPQTSVTVTPRMLYPTMHGVVNKVPPNMIAEGAVVLPQVASSQMPMGVPMTPMLQLMQPVPSHIPIQPPPMHPPISQNVAIGVPLESCLPVAAPPTVVPVTLPLPDPPPTLTKEQEIPGVAHAGEVAPQVGAKAPLDEEAAAHASAANETVNMTSLGDMKQEKTSIARQAIESFQLTLEAKRRRMRGCLEEDCRNVVGEYSLIDVPFPVTFADGHKRFYVRDIVTSLLPYHMFFYNEIKVENDWMAEIGRMENALRPDVDKEIQELRSEVINMRDRSQSLQQNYACAKFSLEEIERISQCIVSSNGNAPPPEAGPDTS